MSNKKLGLILLAVAAVVVIGFGIFKLTAQKAQAPSPPVDLTIDQVIQHQEQNKTEDNKQSDLQGSVSLTAEEVKKHNSKTDCWTIIDGKVYNITEYIPNHPGGSEILRACGADSTTLFTERTTEDGQAVGSGSPHSNNAESQLQKFYLGDLQQ